MHIVIHLRTLDDAMAEAWRAAFHVPGVSIAADDIFGTKADAILSPANSFGFMDGGIDLAYSHRFGWALQDALRARIESEHDGELPVGMALVLPTGSADFPFLVSAPTMRLPSVIDRTANVYLAFRAALLAIRRHNAMAATPIRSLTSPALGAGIGGMPFERVARQMRAAYDEVELGDHAWRRTARGVMEQHRSLLQ